MNAKARVATTTSDCFRNASTVVTNAASTGFAAIARETSFGGPFAQT